MVFLCSCTVKKKTSLFTDFSDVLLEIMMAHGDVVRFRQMTDYYFLLLTFYIR